MKLGSVAVMGLTQARAAARKLLGKVAAGEDPAQDRRDKRASDAVTMRSTVTAFLASKEASLRPASHGELKRYLCDAKYFGAAMHNSALDAVTLPQVAARIDDIARKYGNATAQRARSALSNLFVFAMRRGMAPANPVIGSENPATQSRSRVLNPVELAAVWRACGDDHHGRIVKLLIATACRRGEIGDMAWSEIDFEKEVFVIPITRAKNKPSARSIPLLPMVAGIIDGVPRMASRDCLFGERGRGGFSGWHKAKAALDERSGVSNYVIHDIRRSVATHMAEQCAIAPHVVELVLGHEFRSGTQGTYNRAPYEREIRDAYLRWHDYLRTLIEGGERKVLSFPSFPQTSEIVGQRHA
jgi:integrase